MTNAADALTLSAQAILDEAARHPKMTTDQRTGVAFAVTIMLKIAEKTREPHTAHDTEEAPAMAATTPGRDRP